MAQTAFLRIILVDDGLIVHNEIEFRVLIGYNEAVVIDCWCCIVGSANMWP
jgi:hypothetical protein